MKFEIQSKLFLAAISAAGKVVNPRSPSAILSTLKLTPTSDNVMHITGTDSENVVRTSVSLASCSEPGSFCLDAKRLTELLKMIPDSVIAVSVDAQCKVVITYPKGRYEMMGCSAEDYPEMRPSKGEPTVFSLTTENMLQALDKVSFAAATDAVRPTLCGVYCEVKEDCVTYVATNTYALARYVSRRDLPGVECSFILSLKTVSLLRSVLSKESHLKVTLSDGNVCIEGETASVSSLLVAGKYPNYARVIPDSNDKVMSVDRNELQGAVKRVSVCADCNGLLKFAFSPFDLVVSAQNPDFATLASESVMGEWNADKLTMGLSAPLVSSILETLTSKDVKVMLSEPQRPALFLPANEDADGELTTLLMPMQIM